MQMKQGVPPDGQAKEAKKMGIGGPRCGFRPPLEVRREHEEWKSVEIVGPGFNFQSLTCSLLNCLSSYE